MLINCLVLLIAISPLPINHKLILVIAWMEIQLELKLVMVDHDHFIEYFPVLEWPHHLHSTTFTSVAKHLFHSCLNIIIFIYIYYNSIVHLSSLSLIQICFIFNLLLSFHYVCLLLLFLFLLLTIMNPLYIIINT